MRRWLANAVVGVVEPMMNGMGGDLFVIVYEAKTGKLYGLNASGWAPAKLSIEFLHAKGEDKMPQQRASIPSPCPAWWTAGQKLALAFRKQEIPRSTRAAIHYAKDGFPVPELDAQYWSEAVELLHADPNAAATFLPGGNTRRNLEKYSAILIWRARSRLSPTAAATPTTKATSPKSHRTPRPRVSAA
jgi:gamma-glutamyltranspeptidase/glutathione hydrolase